MTKIRFSNLVHEQVVRKVQGSALLLAFYVFEALLKASQDAGRDVFLSYCFSLSNLMMWCILGLEVERRWDRK